MGGISGARAYTPRGRTVRETADLRRTPRATRSTDPFRPALQVLDGGRTGGGRTARRAPAVGTTTSAAGTGRTVRPVRGDNDVTDPPPPPRRRPRPGGGGGPARRPAPAAARRRQSRKPPRPPRLADPHRRLRVGTLLVLVIFAVVAIRLVVLQVLPAQVYANGGVRDRIVQVDVPAPRGAIYDRSGAALALSVEARYVYADPTRLKDPAAAAEALSPLLGIPRSELLKRMAPRNRPNGRPSEFEYLARGVEIDTAKKIMALELPGINTDRDERREVPGGDLAANLLGFVGEEMIGLEGLEARYDEVLRGINGKREFEVGQGDLAAPIPGGHDEVITEAQPGSSIQLTIDRDLQFEVQRVLSQTMQRVAGSTGAAVVLDARTGEVLAQASHPTYDAANPLDPNTKPTDREDAATSFVVDPGSVHKAIVFAAALEEGVVRPDTKVPVAPAIKRGDQTFRDTHPAPSGTLMSLPGIMAYSSNVGTIKVADALGKEKLYEYQQKFCLGRATGVGLPGEAAGRLLPPDKWSGSSYGSVPIGHSVDATPLQMATVYAAIANNGTWVQPHLVKETIAPDGSRTAAPAPRTQQVISPENAAAVRTMLEAVTTVPDATGRKAAIPGYRVAGKTGTGARLVDGKYVPGEVASFIGMAPADNPRYVIAVFAHTPKGGGGDIASPAFKEMMGFALRHYRVPPTGTKPPNFVVYPR
ncbi:peptidoglycan D,D-transpeptidase FtsI family protein [Micromonospora polyrhachis]|uniref:Cell division protein FtsI (Penicillin-binding protein 3) n=1 Tax=Micromonospora polyrhachis TaxID=1282883 RepID=A0A7W7WRH1_9ACTN|nr:penicillin-binding protein 2 [Micromonospora polyrhachis]MBB4961291.1 cell division protein FtsI (penicillin-binding protein 3) [Micromonospora polyrhachis]